MGNSASTSNPQQHGAPVGNHRQIPVVSDSHQVDVPKLHDDHFPANNSDSPSVEVDPTPPEASGGEESVGAGCDDGAKVQEEVQAEVAGGVQEDVMEDVMEDVAEDSAEDSAEEGVVDNREIASEHSDDKLCYRRDVTKLAESGTTTRSQGVETPAAVIRGSQSPPLMEVEPNADKPNTSDVVHDQMPIIGDEQTDQQQAVLVEKKDVSIPSPIVTAADQGPVRAFYKTVEAPSPSPQTADISKDPGQSTHTPLEQHPIDPGPQSPTYTPQSNPSPPPMPLSGSPKVDEVASPQYTPPLTPFSLRPMETGRARMREKLEYNLSNEVFNPSAGIEPRQHLSKPATDENLSEPKAVVRDADVVMAKPQVENPTSAEGNYRIESPMYIPSESEASDEVQVVSEKATDDKLSDSLRISLQQLNLRNVIVSVPSFISAAPYTSNDKHITFTIQELHRSRRNVSQTGVLVLTSNITKANRWCQLFTRTSKLQAALFSAKKNERLDQLFYRNQVVIALPREAYDECRNELFCLSRIALLVIDSAESIYSHSHVVSYLIRQYYQRLSFSKRPRILAIARDEVEETAMPPLERNLMSRFISVKVSNDQVWPSVYGRGSRSNLNDLIQVEYLYYHTPGDQTVDYSDRKAPKVTKSNRDRRAFSQLDHVVDQVGNVGAAAYTRMKKFIRRKREDPSASEPAPLNIADEVLLVGLTPKTMSLLNELERAFASSVRKQPLSAVVYAGLPVVACSLREVIRAMPVFRSIRVALALGIQSSQGDFYRRARDQFYEPSWQGYDTDEECVEKFLADETQILIVATPYVRSRRDHVSLPVAPVVMRFDGSLPETQKDALGGRCRVVIFRPHEAKRARSLTHPRNSTAADATKSVGEANAVQDTRKIQKSATRRREPSVTRRSSLRHRSKSPHPRDSSQDVDDPGSVKACLPPRALVGPDRNCKFPSYLYRVLAFGDAPSSREEEITSARQCGLEDFLLVFSKPLRNNDLLISLQDHITGTGNGVHISGYLMLDHQGQDLFTEEEVLLGRQYTSQMFSMIIPSVHPKHFIWDSDVVQDQCGIANDYSDRRCYLVLPSKPCESNGDSDDIMEIVTPAGDEGERSKRDTTSQTVISKYFDSTLVPPKRKLKSCEIDWDNVKNFLNLLDSNTYREETRKTDGLRNHNYTDLQGKFVFGAQSDGRLFSMAGGLRYDWSPLSVITRSRKFPLHDDGTFQTHHDLQYLIDVEANHETLQKQASASEKVIPACRQDDEQGHNANGTGDIVDEPLNIDLREMPQGLSPVKWCSATRRLIPDSQVESRKRKRNSSACVFDFKRNVAKKRKVWVGCVRYTNEKYLNGHSNGDIDDLVQPLIETARPKALGLAELHEVIKGRSLPSLFEELVTKGVERVMVAPQLARTFPLSPGAMFLPSALYVIEQHVSICELRRYFDRGTNLEGRIAEIVQAVTSNAVNSSKNYERLEFLGDSLLKLSSTARIFAKLPHSAEGSMHYRRRGVVSNAKLNEVATCIQLYNYLRFQTSTVEDWKPPGTDLRGKMVRITLKGLADVVEALCGAYTIFGAEAPDMELHVTDLDGVPDLDDDSPMLDLSSNSGMSATESDAEPGRQGGTREKTKNRGRKAGKKRRRHLFDPISVQKGYEAGCRFLETASIFEDKEPSQSEMILSAAWAMHPKNSPAPTHITDAFPPDRRLTHPEKPWDEHYGLLERAIGYKFKRRDLLLCALTHGSYGTGSERTFERLEFLGDAVADFCVVWYLYDRFPHLGPGELTTLKGNVVSNEAFARTTVALGLHTFLHYSSDSLDREIKSFLGTVNQDLTNEDEDEVGAHGAFKRSLGSIAAPKALGDVFESLIGAVFVDAGIAQAWRTCTKLLRDSLRINADPNRGDDHPTKELMDLCLKVWKLNSAPRYELNVDRRPKDGRQKGIGERKVAAVYILNTKVAVGYGSTDKRAKLIAAVNALDYLRDTDPESNGAKMLIYLKEMALRRRIESERYLERKKR